MLAEKRVSQKLEARCPGCRSTYRGEILPFLYADELGTRCPTCGDVLAMEGSDSWWKPSGPCHLLLPEGLDGSGLHRKLADLAGSGGGVAGVGGSHRRSADRSPGVPCFVERIRLRGGERNVLTGHGKEETW